MSDHPATISLDRRKLLLGLALGATAGVTLARKPHISLDRLGTRKLEDIIPKKVGGWSFLTTSGLVVPTEDTMTAALYTQLLTRVYVNPDANPIMLLVAQAAGQTGLLQIHRPEFCYPAGGFTLSPIVPRQIAEAGQPLVVNELTATAPGRLEQILYWTRVGDVMPSSWAQQRWANASANLRGEVPDAVLVRVSTISPDGGSNFASLQTFVGAMLTAMGKDRSLLVA